MEEAAAVVVVVFGQIEASSRLLLTDSPTQFCDKRLINKKEKKREISPTFFVAQIEETTRSATQWQPRALFPSLSSSATLAPFLQCDSGFPNAFSLFLKKDKIFFAVLRKEISHKPFFQLLLQLLHSLVLHNNS